MQGIENKVAIVTGGASGIGAATVRVLHGFGAKVVIADLSDDAANALATELGDAALAVHLNVADEASWQAAVTTAEEKFGPINVLVNNAGISSNEPVETESLEFYNKVLSINQTGVWLGMKSVADSMKRSGNGSIINISSIFGLVGGFGASIAYHSTKGAVRLMTKNAAIHWATEGIRVNSIHPGFINTPLMGDTDKKPLEEGAPMKRLGEPTEVANAIAFLASDLASFMTGSEVVVDGGWTTQ